MREERTVDFRGKLMVDKSYSYRSQFVEQLPLNDMLPLLEDIFKQGILAIKWHQYIPSFNDGDACEFSIGDVRVTSNPEVVETWIDGGTFNDDYYDEDYIERQSGHADGPATGNISTPIGLPAYEYATRAEFGDNVEIVITPEATYTFDYDCGY